MMTGNQADPDIIVECHALIEAKALQTERPKPIATFKNVVDMIEIGIFGLGFVQHYPHEQVQLAAFNLLMVFCAVCPLEILEGQMKQAALRYADLAFFILPWEDEGKEAHTETDSNSLAPRPRFCLHCDVHFCKLKGSSACLAKWRDQPLYSHSREACLDVVLLLAHLGELDNVFAEGVSIASALPNADAMYFETNQFLHIPMCEEAKELYVFWAMEAHTLPKGLHSWSISPDKPLTTDAIGVHLCKAAQAAGLIGYTPYALCCLLINV